MTGRTYTEAEVAALVEAAGHKAIERAASICAQGAIRLMSNGRKLVNQVDKHIAFVLRDKEKEIRALVAPTPHLDAIRAEARRDGSDLAFRNCWDAVREWSESNGGKSPPPSGALSSLLKAEAAIAAAIEKEGGE